MGIRVVYQDPGAIISTAAAAGSRERSDRRRRERQARQAQPSVAERIRQQISGNFNNLAVTRAQGAASVQRAAIGAVGRPVQGDISQRRARELSQDAQIAQAQAQRRDNRARQNLQEGVNESFQESARIEGELDIERALTQASAKSLAQGQELVRELLSSNASGLSFQQRAAHQKDQAAVAAIEAAPNLTRMEKATELQKIQNRMIQRLANPEATPQTPQQVYEASRVIEPSSGLPLVPMPNGTFGLPQGAQANIYAPQIETQKIQAKERSEARAVNQKMVSEARQEAVSEKETLIGRIENDRQQLVDQRRELVLSLNEASVTGGDRQSNLGDAASLQNRDRIGELDAEIRIKDAELAAAQAAPVTDMAIQKIRAMQAIQAEEQGIMQQLAADDFAARQPAREAARQAEANVRRADTSGLVERTRINRQQAEATRRVMGDIIEATKGTAEGQSIERLQDLVLESQKSGDVTTMQLAQRRLEEILVEALPLLEKARADSPTGSQTLGFSGPPDAPQPRIAPPGP